MAVEKLRGFFANHPDVRFVRFLVMDHASLLRVSVMLRAAALDVAEQGFFNSPIAEFVRRITTFDTPNWETIRPGVDKIIPDWESLKVCTFYPTHAMVMCAVQEPPLEVGGAEGEGQNGTTKSASATSGGKETDNGENQGNEGATTGSYDDRDGFSLCPRTILAKQVKRAETINGELDILVGIELEFYLYKPEADADFTRPKPSSNFNISSLYNHQVTRILDEVALLLAEADINIMKYLPEPGASGVFELVLPPYAPMQAADAMVYCRETLKNVAQKHGYEATLCPYPFEKGAALGAHTSISIKSDAATANSFLAGILGSLVSINAFAMSSVQSARRYSDGAPTRLVRWGRDNKTSPDGTMNPYLTIAALIATGISGIETEKELTIKPTPGMSPKAPTDEEKSELGIVDSIPGSLELLLIALKKDSVLKAAFGDRLIQAYTQFKKLEIEATKDMTVREISERLRVLF